MKTHYLFGFKSVVNYLNSHTKKMNYHQKSQYITKDKKPYQTKIKEEEHMYIPFCMYHLLFMKLKKKLKNV